MLHIGPYCGGRGAVGVLALQTERGAGPRCLACGSDCICNPNLKWEF